MSNQVTKPSEGAAEVQSMLMANIRRVLSEKQKPLLINLTGLSISLVLFFSAILYVQHELSYDEWLRDSDRIFRYETVFDFAGRPSDYSMASPPAALPALVGDFSEIEAAARILRRDVAFKAANRTYFETLWFADETFLEVIDLPMVVEPSTRSLRPNTILVSQTIARKYFGGEAAVGQTISEANGNEFFVSGVFRDIPDNSQFNFEFIVLYDPDNENFGPGYTRSWRAVDGYTYLKLRPQVDYESINQQLARFIDKHAGAHVASGRSRASETIHPYLFPLKAVHLAGRGSFHIKPESSYMRVYAVSVMATLTLLIACVNYVNIATASATLRAKEVAIRKTVGASRKSLVLKFLFESLTAVMVAVLFSLVLLEFSLPYFNELIDKNLSVRALGSFSGAIGVVLLTIAVAITSGFYPAIVMSAFKPGRVLAAGTAPQMIGGRWFRGILVSMQFLVSLVLVLVAIVVAHQQLFISSKDLGYSGGNKLVLRNMSKEFVVQNREVIANEIRNIPGIEGLAFSQVVPTDPLDLYLSVDLLGRGLTEPVDVTPVGVDHDFLKLYDTNLLAGRMFSREFGSDELLSLTDPSNQPRRAAAIINESAARKMAFRPLEEAVGNVIVFGNGIELEIVGVVEDFHMRSLVDDIHPYLYFVNRSRFSNLTLRFRGDNDAAHYREAVAVIWRELVPDHPPIIDDLQELTEAQYDDQRQLLTLVSLIALCAIFIACIGLYGVGLFHVATRQKEVAIRVVHGAPHSRIIGLFLWRFLRPIVIAVLPAWAVGFYIGSEYLNSYSYRIDISLFLFGLATTTIFALAALTVVTHVMFLARTRPSRVLRDQ